MDNDEVAFRERVKKEFSTNRKKPSLVGRVGWSISITVTWGFVALILWFFAWPFVVEKSQRVWVEITRAIHVVDPADPNFRPDEFRFSRYRSAEELETVILAMFPVGTSRDYVNKILVEHAGAEVRDIGDNMYRYRGRGLGFKQYGISKCPNPNRWNVVIKFDEKDEMKDVRIGAGCFVIRPEE